MYGVGGKAATWRSTVRSQAALQSLKAIGIGGGHMTPIKDDFNQAPFFVQIRDLADGRRGGWNQLSHQRIRVKKKANSLVVNRIRRFPPRKGENNLLRKSEW